MEDKTIANDNSDFQPREVARALERVLDAELKKSPVEITDGGNPYRVTGLDSGFFKVEQLAPAGGGDSGTIDRLSCDEHRLRLVLTQIKTWEMRAQAATAGGGLAGSL